MKHSDHITHIDNPEDQRYLKVPLFDVNMRLFHTSPQYRALVQAAAAEIARLCLTKAEGYKLPHGMSGANAGIPWNIIAIALNRGTERATALVMLNPRIISHSEDTIETQSNCGSLVLPEPVTVRRWREIDIEWWDPADGVRRTRNFFAPGPGSTIQHEIDHNLGILITDRKAS